MTMRHGDFKYQMCIIDVLLRFTSLCRGKCAADRALRAVCFIYLAWRGDVAHEDITRTRLFRMIPVQGPGVTSLDVLTLDQLEEHARNSFIFLLFAQEVEEMKLYLRLGSMSAALLTPAGLIPRSTPRRLAKAAMLRVAW